MSGRDGSIIWPHGIKHYTVKMACEIKTQSEIPVILPIEFPSVHPGSVLSALKCRATLGQGNWLFLKSCILARFGTLKPIQMLEENPHCAVKWMRRGERESSFLLSLSVCEALQGDASCWVETDNDHTAEKMLRNIFRTGYGPQSIPSTVQR